MVGIYSNKSSLEHARRVSRLVSSHNLAIIPICKLFAITWATCDYLRVWLSGLAGSSLAQDMMRGLIIIALLCMFGAPTKSEVTFNKHEFYTGPPNFIQIPQDEIDLLFKGLDKNGDGKLDGTDLAEVFNNPRAAGDADKFIDEADSEDVNKEVDPAEFKKFMSDQSAVWAVAGCKFVKATAQALKLQCYQDEFVAYIHALMPFAEVVEVFKAFDNDGNGEITKEDIEKRLKIKGKEPNEQDLHDVVENLFDEWGHEDQKATFTEFKSYVRQGEVYVEMKPCKHKTSCNKNMLIKYTAYSVTEQDIFKLFQILDKDQNGFLDAVDLRQHTTNPEAFLNLVNQDNDKTASFEEFRLFMKRVLIKNILEEYCAVIYNSQKQQDCYVEHLFGLLRFAYNYAKIFIPHSDILYLFEELDKDQSGEIEDGDLATFEPNEELRKYMLTELDTSSKHETINLEEVMYFLSYPSTIYAISACLYEAVDKRSDCFAKKFVEFASHMMRADAIEKFFGSYDSLGTHKINKEDVDKMIPAGDTHDEDVENFINELGLGDDEVTLFEFASYVRHPDLREDFEKCTSIEEKQATLLKHIQEKLTEYDVETVFDKYDTNRDLEIDLEDLRTFEKPDDLLPKYLKAMNSDNDEKNINFKEFRHYLLQAEHRKLLEEQCTIPLKSQVEEINCYLEKIWEMVAN